MTGPAEILQDWLARFQAALEARDAAAAAALFDDTCYWRDMLAFTWNIKILEGRDAIAAMLGETLGRVQPGIWAPEGSASEADGAVESWLSFQTQAGTGKVHVRLKDGKCWTCSSR